MPTLARFIRECCRALSDSGHSSRRITAGFLFLLSLSDASATAQTPAVAQGSNRPDASPSASALITVSNFARPGMLIEIQGIAVIGDEAK